MTFLGWMHRKLMHNNTEPVKNSTIGNPCACFSVQTLFDEHDYCVEPTKTLSRSNINCQKSSNRFESNKVEGLSQEESFEPFEFLAIGTFGVELLNTDPPTPTLPPPTPTLPLPSENLTNQQREIIENDLKLINYELEKFYEAEEKEIANDTSERSSQASVITLSNKPIEGGDSEGHKYFMACPLQNYLFATSTEVSDTDKEVKKEKTSLEELFKRNNVTHDDPTRKPEGAEEQPRKRNVAHFIKKVVKKIHSSSSGPTASPKNETTVSISMKKKISKALKMLHKKVHPGEMTEKQYTKMQKSEKKNIFHEDACRMRGDDEIKMVGQAASKKSEKNTRKLSSNGICKGAPTINAGHWIKTDSDYLVLEL